MYRRFNKTRMLYRLLLWGLPGELAIRSLWLGKVFNKAEIAQVRLIYQQQRNPKQSSKPRRQELFRNMKVRNLTHGPTVYSLKVYNSLCFRRLFFLHLNPLTSLNESFKLLETHSKLLVATMWNPCRLLWLLGLRSRGSLSLRTIWTDK